MNAILPLLPVLVVLALGVYAGLRKRVDNQRPEQLIALLMQYALPCSLFLGVGSSSPKMLASQLPLMGILLVAMLAIYALVFLFARKFGELGLGEAAVLALTSAFANNVAIGLPFVASIEGPSGRLVVMSGIVVGALVLSPVTLVLLELDAQRSDSAAASVGMRHALLHSLRRPVIVAPLLGLLLSLSGYTLPPVIASSLDLIGKATIGIALFLTGLILSAQRFRFSWTTAVSVLAKNLLQPVIVWLLMRWFGVHGTLAQQLFLLSCVPAGFFGTVFGARQGLRSCDAGATLVLSTLFGAATLPLAVHLAHRL
ncbi:AEC family transporter [Granulicella cerasi]|uniref:AEC family transporter n=1 Tax=Granulicella cerasi TaxID=741063 RepID=A0ABW1Z9B9_9BACT|nr:AEC family transporter [Granulicella cerasi]